MQGGRNWGVQGRGRVGLPPVVQRPELPVRSHLTVGGWLTLFVVRPAWLWRRELAAVWALGAVAAAGWLAAGWPAGVAGPVLLVVWLAAVPWTRQRAVSAWRRGRLRRRWDRACRFAGLATVNDRIPRIVRHREVPAGDRLMVRVPKGSERAELEEAAERVAAVLRVRQIRITRDTERADLAHVDVVRRDPFDGTDPRMPARLPWPWRDRRQVSLWDPVPVAVDDMGDTITLSLPGRHLLIGGEPEAGKSTALSAVLAAGALDPNVRLIGLDAKRLELALWRPVFDRLVFNNMGDAIDTLDELIGEMDRRYEHLEQAGRRSWRPSDGPLYLIPIDELRFYTACEDRKAREAFNARAIDLAARGRAAGMILAPATQKPSTDVVRSSFRDLLAVRWAMRCSTRDASDTILGAGWATNGYNAAEIDISTRGVGWLLAEGGLPRRCKSYFLSDAEISDIATRGAALRRLAAGDRWI